MNRATPLFPEIAQAEGETLPPFEPFVCFPKRLGVDRSLTPSDKMVMFAVLHMMRGKRVDCWASNRDLSELVGINTSSVRRCLEHLETAGYLVRHKDPSVKAGDQRRIELNFRTWDAPTTAEKTRQIDSEQTHGGRAPETGGARARDRGSSYRLARE